MPNLNRSPAPQSVSSDRADPPPPRARYGRPGRAAALAGVALLAALAGTAQARLYTFVNIADDNDQIYFSYETIPYPSINAGGTVAFHAYFDSGDGGIFKGDGGPLTTVAGDPSVLRFFDEAPAINDSGAVVYRVTYFGEQRIYRAGATTTLIADSTGPLGWLFGPHSINNSGTVAFTDPMDLGGSAVLVGDGGPLTTIIDSTGPFYAFSGADINESGAVLFYGSDDSGGQGIYLDGTAFGTLTVANTGGIFSSFYYVPSLNAGNRAAFRANLDAGGEGVFTATFGVTPNVPGPPFTVADTSGPFFRFGPPAINDANEVVFAARLDAGGDGIFTGPDPATDTVIRTGDPLFGSTVADLYFSRGLNNKGDIAFHYRLANGMPGIAVAYALCNASDLAHPFGTLNFFDFTAYVALFNAQDPAADLAAPFGVFNFFDMSAYLAGYNAGCS